MQTIDQSISSTGVEPILAQRNWEPDSWDKGIHGLGGMKTISFGHKESLPSIVHSWLHTPIGQLQLMIGQHDSHV